MEESRLIKLMANFPACDLGEAYFKRWKEIFSEAVEFEKEVQALRSWKEKARPFMERQLHLLKTYPADFYPTYLLEVPTLTELLGGDDETKTN